MIFPLDLIMWLVLSYNARYFYPVAVIFLIHYLLRSGKPMPFPEKENIYWASRIRFLETNERVTRDGVYGMPQLEIGKFYVAIRLDFTATSGIKTFYDPYYAVGKYIYGTGIDSETGKNMGLYFDRYEFYRWCNVDNHFKNCTCSNHEFETHYESSIGAEIFQPKFLNALAYNILTYVMKKHPDYLTFVEEHITDPLFDLNRKLCITLKDKDLVNKGKPFYSFRWVEISPPELEKEVIIVHDKLTFEDVECLLGGNIST